MDFTLKQYAKGAFFIFTNYFLFRQILRRKGNIQSLNQVRKEQIISPKLAINKFKQNNSRQQYLIKIVPYQFQQVNIKKDAHSNQIQFLEPSTIQIADKFIKLIQKGQKSNFKAQKKLQRINYSKQWVGKDQQGQIYLMKGLGIILDNNIFQIKWKYERQKIGFFKSIWKFLCYFLEYILSLKNSQFHNKRSISLNKERKPIILGPVVGSIYYKLKLFTNRTILVQAIIDDGRIVPKMIGSSKLQFIQFFSNQILNSNIRIGLLAFASLVSYRLIYKNLKKGLKELVKNIKMRNHKKKSKIKFFQSQSADITDDKLCIICYNACRSTIIFNCRHVIMCNQCAETYHQQICPICKNQIDSYQRFYQQ